MLLLAWKELTWHAGTTTTVRRALGQFRNGHDDGNAGAWKNKNNGRMDLRSSDSGKSLVERLAENVHGTR
jgi:hypothetical protein